MIGDFTTQVGNAFAFNDQYSVGRTLFAGATGGLIGGITGHLTKASNAAIPSVVPEDTVDDVLGNLANASDDAVVNASIKTGNPTAQLPDGTVMQQLGDGSWVRYASNNQVFTHGYTYHPRIRIRSLEDPTAHNFPYSFDDGILKTTPNIQKDGSLIYSKSGTLNGKSGVFEIALNPETKIIFHRTFRGIK